MEEAYDSLKQEGKNNLTGIIQWLKDANIIDGKTITEEQARVTFENATGEVSVDKFQEGLKALAEKKNESVDSFISKLCGTGTALEQAFQKLKNEGKNNVDNVIQWMKDTKIMDSAKESEEKARKLFSDVKDQQKIEFSKFKEAVTKMTEEKTQQFGEMLNLVSAQAPRLLNAFGAASSAATSAFKDAMNK